MSTAFSGRDRLCGSAKHVECTRFHMTRTTHNQGSSVVRGCCIYFCRLPQRIPHLLVLPHESLALYSIGKEAPHKILPGAPGASRCANDDWWSVPTRCEPFNACRDRQVRQESRVNKRRLSDSNPADYSRRFLGTISSLVGGRSLAPPRCLCTELCLLCPLSNTERLPLLFNSQELSYVAYMHTPMCARLRTCCRTGIEYFARKASTSASFSSSRAAAVQDTQLVLMFRSLACSPDS